MVRPDSSEDAHTRTGETIATESGTVIVTARTYGIEFTVKKLHIVERVLELQLNTSPLMNPGTPALWFIGGDVSNVVGVTICEVASGVTVVGTTVTALLTCIGQ